MAHTLGFMLAAKAVIESRSSNAAQTWRPLIRRQLVWNERSGQCAFPRSAHHCRYRFHSWAVCLFGYDNIVISGAIGYLSQLFHLDAAGIGWAAGCALVGCIAGCAAAGTVADYLGKKKGPRALRALFCAVVAGMLFAANLHQFVLWRLIGGVGIGAASVISPNYIAEIAPTRVRGRCVTLYQLGIVVGILAAVFVNMLIQRMGDEAWNISTGWRWMFLAGVVPGDSIRIDDSAGGRKSALVDESGPAGSGHLRVLTQINGAEAARQEAAEIENSLATEEGHISELFTTFRRPLLAGHHAGGVATDQRNHAAIFFPARDFSRRRNRNQRRIFSVRAGEPGQSSCSLSSRSGWWIVPGARR